MVEDPICDFCSSSEVRWLYPAQSFSGTLIGIGDHEVKTQEFNSIGGWAACNVCHDLIELQDIEGLITRALELHSVPRSQMNTLRSAMRDYHSTFWETKGVPEAFVG